jgi:predicted AAA+ superfamily ATPase
MTARRPYLGRLEGVTLGAVHDLLVGRETESFALDRAMDATAFGLNAVLVTGEAGVGKSALTRALLDRAAASRQHLGLGGELPPH